MYLSKGSFVFFPIRLLIIINKAFIKIESFFLTTTLITMLAFASLQVILRNFFDTGIEWGDVFARHLVLWVGFFGASLATQDDRHIRIDALAKCLPKKYLPLVDFCVSVFSIIVGFLLTMAAYRFMMDEKMAQTILFEGIPTWYFISIMPIGFGLMTFRFSIRLLEMLTKFGAPKSEKQPQDDLPSELDISVKIKLK